MLPLKGMCTALSNTIKASTVTAKEIISMGWKDFGVTLKEDWPPLGKKLVLGWMAFIGCVIIFQWMKNNDFFGLF